MRKEKKRFFSLFPKLCHTPPFAFPPLVHYSLIPPKSPSSPLPSKYFLFLPSLSIFDKHPSPGLFFFLAPLPIGAKALPAPICPRREPLDYSHQFPSGWKQLLLFSPFLSFTWVHQSFRSGYMEGKGRRKKREQKRKKGFLLHAVVSFLFPPSFSIPEMVPLTLFSNPIFAPPLPFSYRSGEKSCACQRRRSSRGKWWLFSFLFFFLRAYLRNPLTSAVVQTSRGRREGEKEKEEEMAIGVPTALIQGGWRILFWNHRKSNIFSMLFIW